MPGIAFLVSLVFLTEEWPPESEQLNRFLDESVIVGFNRCEDNKPNFVGFTRNMYVMEDREFVPKFAWENPENKKIKSFLVPATLAAVNPVDGRIGFFGYHRTLNASKPSIFLLDRSGKLRLVFSCFETIFGHRYP